MKKFLLLYLYVISMQAAAQDWKLKKDKGGVKVYIKHNHHSPFNLLKAESEIAVSTEKMIELIFDVARHKEWVYNTVQSVPMKRIGPREIIYYGETYAPWPVSNRDLVLHLTAKLDSASGIWTVKAISEPHLKPLVEGKVRVPKSVSEWKLVPIKKNYTHVTYTLDIDPGGNLPAWLVNFASIEGPYLSFIKLKEILLK